MAKGTTDLLMDCREQKLIPNPAHPNQPMIKIWRNTANQGVFAFSITVPEYTDAMQLT